MAEFNIYYNNESFNTFFDIVHKLEEKSLIYKIITKVGEKVDDRYEVIEDVAIHNIEVLELLEDYLGNINKLRLPQGDNENPNRVLKFIENLSYFKYYRYTGDTYDMYKDFGYKCISVICESLNQMNAEAKELFYNIYNTSSYEKPDSNNSKPISKAESGKGNQELVQN